MEIQMTKTDQLFIRACKSKNPLTRVQSVYRRFYIEKNNTHPYIAMILAELCDRFNTFTTTQFILEMSHNNNWRYGNDAYSFYLQCINRLISKIRFTDGAKFVGLTAPLAFRKQ